MAWNINLKLALCFPIIKIYVYEFWRETNNKSIKSFFYLNIRFCNPTECMQERMESELEAKRKEYLRSVGKIQLDTEQVGGFSPNIWRIFCVQSRFEYEISLKEKNQFLFLSTFWKDIEQLFFLLRFWPCMTRLWQLRSVAALPRTGNRYKRTHR